MKNYRIFLLSIVTFSGFFSIGFGMPVAATAAAEKPKTALELESVEVKKTHRLLETNLVKTKKKQPSDNAKESSTDKSNTSGYNELEKPLDLSIPYKSPENAGVKIKQNTSAQSPETNIFAPEAIKKSRPLQLDGNFLMSPEPEAEKQKSVDGAGIVINIKP